MLQKDKVYTQGEFFKFMRDVFTEKYGFPATNNGVWYGGLDSDEDFFVSVERKHSLDSGKYMFDGWCICLIVRFGAHEGEDVFMSTSKGKPRTFKTLDAVERVLRDNGVSNFRVLAD